MRTLTISINNKHNADFNEIYATELPPSDILFALTNTYSGRVIEGITVESWLINGTYFHINIGTEIDFLPRLNEKYILDRIKSIPYDFIVPENYNKDKITLIQLPFGLTDEEKFEITEVIKELKDTKANIVDYQGQYKHELSHFLGDFIVSTAANVTSKVIERLYDYFKNDSLQKSLNKTSEITNKVKIFISQHTGIHENKLVLSHFDYDDGDYELMFNAPNKKIFVKMDKTESHITFKVY